MGPRDRASRVNPNMIILARESRGMQQKTLAEQLKVTQGRISKIEMGLLTIPEELLERLAAALHYPLHFFYQEGQIMGVGVAELFHRKRKDVPQKDLSRIYATIEIRARHIEALCKAAEVPSTMQRLDVDEYDGRVEEIAMLARSTWNVPRGPIANLTQTMEDMGIIIVPCEFGTRKVDAISRWVGSLPPMIFVNPDSPKDRYRFSLAHELGHLIMHAVPNPEIEDQADRFAAEFLMPEREVRADLTGLSLQQLPQLKRYWRVSMASLIKKAGDIGAITESQSRYLWARMAQAGYRTREPAELDVTGEQITLLYELVDTHRVDLGYGEEDLQSLLALESDELWVTYLERNAKSALRLLN